MSITSIDVTYQNPGSSDVDYTYTADPQDGRTPVSGFMFFGPSNTFDPLQPMFGLAESARVSMNGNEFATNVSPGVPEGSVWYFVCGVNFSDGTTQASDLQEPTNQPDTGAEATAVTLKGTPADINKTAQPNQATITLTAVSAAGPTRNRPVNFGFQTGSVKGTFSQANPVMTDGNGNAAVKFTPLEPGQAHIEAECDGLKAAFKVKIKNA
jgi:hypothetical protein